MSEKDISDQELNELDNKPLDELLKESEPVNVSTPAGGLKVVVSIRMNGRTLEALDEYAKTIGEKITTVARGFIIEGLENSGMGMSSDELHELTKLRMKEEARQTKTTSPVVPTETSNITWASGYKMVEKPMTNVIDFHPRKAG